MDLLISIWAIFAISAISMLMGHIITDNIEAKERKEYHKPFLEEENNKKELDRMEAFLRGESLVC